jgi:hypothetical protein
VREPRFVGAQIALQKYRKNGAPERIKLGTAMSLPARYNFHNDGPLCAKGRLTLGKKAIWWRRSFRRARC